MPRMLLRREFLGGLLAAASPSFSAFGQQASSGSSSGPFVERSALPNQPHKGKVLLAVQAHSDDIPLSAAGKVAKGWWGVGVDMLGGDWGEL